MTIQFHSRYYVLGLISFNSHYYSMKSGLLFYSLILPRIICYVLCYQFNAETLYEVWPLHSWNIQSSGGDYNKQLYK